MLVLSFTSRAGAEAVFDGTTGPNAAGTTLSGDFVVDESDGDVAGTNLFHSFETFGVGDGESATFTTGGSIDHIITRVTGDDASLIAGPITVDPGVAFHLLNPMGILMSEGAALDVSGGAFLTTADAMRLDDGIGGAPEFFTVADPVPTLSVQAPASYLFSPGATGRIDIEGDPDAFTLFLLTEGAATSLYASEVRIDGAFLGATSSLVQLAAVGSGGAEVPLALEGWSPTGAAGEVTLSSDSFLCLDIAQCTGGDATLPDRGRVVVRGGRLVLDDSAIIAGGNGVSPVAIDVAVAGDVTMSGLSSALWSYGEGASPVGGITVQADSIALSDATIGIAIESDASAAPLALDATRALTIDGTLVASSAMGAGAGADVIVTAGALDLIGGGQLSSSVIGPGQGGAIQVGVGTLGLVAGSQLTTATSGSGAGGDLAIAVTGAMNVDRSSVGASTTGAGAGGDLRVTADSLALTRGAQITTSTDGLGGGGDLIVDVTGDIDIDGFDLVGGEIVNSGLFARSGSGAGVDAGPGGLLEVHARAMTMTGAAEVSVSTSGTGAAGSMVLDVDEALVVQGDGTSINARGREGPGGDITIAAGSLLVAEQAEIASEATLQGDAGDIVIDADTTIEVRGGRITSALRGVLLPAEGADIRLEAGEAILLRDGGLVSAEGASTRRAGDIRLTSPGEISIDRSLVTARATESGDAGTVIVDAGRFEMTSSAIATESDRSAGGRISVTSDSAADITGSRIETSVLEIGDGNGGDVDVTARDRILVNRSVLEANARDGLGGDLTLTADALLISADSVLSATSETSIDGNIVLNSPDVNLVERLARLPDQPIDPASLFAARCAARDPDARSSFVVAGREGTPWLAQDWMPPLHAPRPSAQGDDPPEVAEAVAALRIGDLVSAAERFDAAAASTKDAALAVSALLASASALEAAGALVEADLRRADARDQAAGAGLTRWVALADADRAHARALWADAAGAEEALEAARATLERVGTPLDRAGVAHRLGDVHQLSGDVDAAIDAYLRAAEIAADLDGEAAQLVRARASGAAARLALELGDTRRAEALLASASQVVRPLRSSSALAQTRIHLGESWRRLAPLEGASLRAYTQLVAAKNEAEAGGDAHTTADAWAVLARLYADEGRLDEALELARLSAREAARARAPERSARAERAIARSLSRLGRRSQAMAAYARALTEQDALRFERPPPGFEFRRDAASTHYELADLQLSAAAEGADAERSQALLRDARASIEKSKTSELRDYFRDACVDEFAAMQRSVDEVSEGALVVYPIVLPDRVVLLASVAGAPLRQVVVETPGAELERDVRALRRTLTKRATRQYVRPAQRIYDVLIRPLEPLLTAHQPEVLVFVPDGALRTIPIAALHDGESFLIERFPVATAPSIELASPRALPDRALSALVAGISESRLGMSALPFVPEEVSALESRVDADVLLDSAFTTEALEEHVRDREYDVVHFATHAQFGRSARDSWLLAYDGRIGLDRLQSVIGRFRYRDTPLELLALSACETAAGDDRAALGLSGIAVRAGARSVLGTIWSIDDEAASGLVVAFYDQITTNEVSRAEALRRAQLALLAERRTRHPFFWAPFVLINSWL